MAYTVADARDDLAAMVGSYGLLRVVHDESVAPAGNPPEVVVTTTIGPREPRYGDPAGVDAYQAACRELAHLWRYGMTALGVGQLPAFVVEGYLPSPHESDAAARALAAFLDELGRLRASETGNGGPRRAGGMLLAVKRARAALQAAAGATCVAAPAPPCRTPGCGGEQQHGYYCHACVRYKQRHGQLPDRVAGAG